MAVHTPRIPWLLGKRHVGNDVAALARTIVAPQNAQVSRKEAAISGKGNGSTPCQPFVDPMHEVLENVTGPQRLKATKDFYLLRAQFADIAKVCSKRNYFGFMNDVPVGFPSRPDNDFLAIASGVYVGTDTAGSRRKHQLHAARSKFGHADRNCKAALISAKPFQEATEKM